MPRPLAHLRHLDYHYRAWRYRWRVEPAEVAFVRGHLTRGATAVDVGAHKGAFTYWMRRAVGAPGRVAAFEPQVALAERLRDVVADLGWTNVVVEAAAVSDRSGARDLHVPGGGAPSPGATLEEGVVAPGDATARVPVVRLDDWADGHDLREVSLVKCDVEGHELAVFRGAERLLRRDRPALLFECEVRHHVERRIDHVLRHVEGLGYRGWLLWGDRRIPVEDFDPALHQDPTRRPHGNNFAFLPR